MDNEGLQAPTSPPPGETEVPAPTTPEGGELSPPEGEEQVRPEGEPEDKGGEEGAERWWAQPESEDSLREHERVKSWLDEAQTSARKEAEVEARRQMQPRLDAQNAHLKGLREQLDGFWSSFNSAVEAIKSGDGDADSLSRVLDANKTNLAALSGVHYNQGFKDVFLGSLNQDGVRVPGVIEALLGERADEFVERARNVLEMGMKDQSFYGDLKETLTKQAVSEALERERPKIEKQVRERMEAEDQARKRNETPPPAAPKGGGATGQKKYSELTPEERSKLTPEQRDRYARQALGG